MSEVGARKSITVVTMNRWISVRANLKNEPQQKKQKQQHQHESLSSAELSPYQKATAFSAVHPTHNTKKHTHLPTSF
jgi:hypothetical protein